MTREDLLFDDNNTLIIENSDVKWGISDKQHVIDTINANVGSWKENPYDGVGIKRHLSGSNVRQFLSKNIRKELNKDLYNCNPVIRENTTDGITVYPNINS